MTRFTLFAGFCVLAMPAVAQGDPIYAPCLQQFPAPDEFADASAYIDAMEEAGWTHRTWGMMRNRAAPPLAEVAGVVFFPSRFRNAIEAQTYVDQARERFEGSMDLLEIFTRDGMSASLSAVELDPGVISVSCTFAGLSVPGVAALTAETSEADAEFAIVARPLDPDTSDDGGEARGSVFRFQGPDDVLAPLSAREGLQMSFEYTAPD